MAEQVDAARAALEQEIEKLQEALAAARKRLDALGPRAHGISAITEAEPHSALGKRKRADDEEEDFFLSTPKGLCLLSQVRLCELKEKRKRVQRERRVPRGTKGPPLKGELPTVSLEGITFCNSRMQVYVERRQGEHPSMPGVFYWTVRACGYMFTGWYTADEVRAEVLACCDAVAAPPS